MNSEVSKKTLIWSIVVVGKVLLAMTVWNLNKISGNLDTLNDNVNQLINITSIQGVEIKNVKHQVEQHDKIFEELFKQHYENKK